MPKLPSLIFERMSVPDTTDGSIIAATYNDGNNLRHQVRGQFNDPLAIPSLLRAIADWIEYHKDRR